MSSLKIELNSNLNRKGFDEAKKASEDLSRQAYQQSVKQGQLFRSERYQAQAQLNLFRQGSDIFTSSSLGASPLTVAIQQGPQILDILASGALSVGSIASSVAMIGVGVVGVGYTIKKVKELQEAQKELANVEYDVLDGITKKAIQYESEGVTKAESEGASKILSIGVGKALNAGNQKLADYFSKLNAKITTGDLIKLGEQNAFNRKTNQSEINNVLNPKSQQTESMLADLFVSQTTPTDVGVMIEKYKASLSKIQEDALAGKGTSKSADEANRLIDNIKSLEDVLSKYEERIGNAKELKDKFTTAFADFGEKLAKSFTTVPKEDQTKDDKIDPIRNAMTDARTRIGGMANAPILSAYQTQIQLLRQIATNTSMRTPPASPATAMPVGGN